MMQLVAYGAGDISIRSRSNNECNQYGSDKHISEDCNYIRFSKGYDKLPDYFCKQVYFINTIKRLHKEFGASVNSKRIKMSDCHCRDRTSIPKCMDHEWSALAIAARWSRYDTVKYLLENGADSNIEDNHHGELQTPLDCLFSHIMCSYDAYNETAKERVKNTYRLIESYGGTLKKYKDSSKISILNKILDREEPAPALSTSLVSGNTLPEKVDIEEPQPTLERVYIEELVPDIPKVNIISNHTQCSPLNCIIM